MFIYQEVWKTRKKAAHKNSQPTLSGDVQVAAALPYPPDNQTGHLFSLHHAAFFHGGTALKRTVCYQRCTANIGCGKTRTSYHHMHSLFQRFNPERLHKTLHGKLGSRITGTSRQAFVACNGRNPDDGTTAFQDRRQGILCAIHRSPRSEEHTSELQSL